MTIFGTFYGRLSMSIVILIAVDSLSNTAESDETKNLIDDPDGDVELHCLREYFSLGNAIYKPRHWSHAKICVNGRPIL